MSKQFTLPRRAALIAAAVAMFAALQTAPTLAQTPTPVPGGTPSAQSSQQTVERKAQARQGARRIRRELLARAAAALKMTPRELLADLRTGKSVAEIAQSRSVPLDVVRDALLAPFKTRLDKAVADSRLTRAQADERLVKVSARVDRLLARKWSARAAQ
jgi:hypothetical protein